MTLCHGNAFCMHNDVMTWRRFLHYRPLGGLLSQKARNVGSLRISLIQKTLNKQLIGRWYETPMWRHCNVFVYLERGSQTLDTYLFHCKGTDCCNEIEINTFNKITYLKFRSVPTNFSLGFGNTRNTNVTIGLHVTLQVIQQIYCSLKFKLGFLPEFLLVSMI